MDWRLLGVSDELGGALYRRATSVHAMAEDKIAGASFSGDGRASGWSALGDGVADKLALP